MNFQAYYQYIPGITAIILIATLSVIFLVRKRTLLKSRPFLYSIPVLIGIALLITTFFFTKALRAEYYFQKSLDSKVIKDIYDNQKLAIITNPKKDIYRVRFSQTNLIIANTVISKSSNQSNQDTAKPVNSLSAEDRQIATKGIQASLEEAKAAIKLNDRKAANWANLANIYKNLLNFAEEADAWSISAYQRAILLDPKNPYYHLELGGVYYLLKNYDEAIKKFKETINLSPNLPNAYYNLAWTYFQKGERAKAISNMETTISLLTKNKNSDELKRAVADLDRFKDLRK